MSCAKCILDFGTDIVRKHVVVEDQVVRITSIFLCLLLCMAMGMDRLIEICLDRHLLYYCNLSESLDQSSDSPAGNLMHRAMNIVVPY